MSNTMYRVDINEYTIEKHNHCRVQGRTVSYVPSKGTKSIEHGVVKQESKSLTKGVAWFETLPEAMDLLESNIAKRILGIRREEEMLLEKQRLLNKFVWQEVRDEH